VGEAIMTNVGSEVGVARGIEQPVKATIKTTPIIL
jgi:hypothetical protein